MTTSKRLIQKESKTKQAIKNLRKEKAKIVNEISNLRDIAEQEFWASIANYARVGDIAITKDVARAFLHNYNFDLTAHDSAELENYIALCEAQTVLNRGFAHFYRESSVFGKICDYFASGNTITYGRPRLADSGYRSFRCLSMNNCITRISAIFSTVGK